MKTRVCFLLRLSAFAFTPAFAASPAKQALSHPVGSVARFGNIVVTRGSSVSDVATSLGWPHSKLSAHVWAYKGFNGGSEQHRDDDCSTLLVTFVEGRVVDLKLVNDRAEKVLAARLSTNAPDKIQVAAK